jgi:hypothetical protein
METFGKTMRQRTPVAEGRERAQRGSALLIVFVFAAIVAIMLYRELPVAAFEAQRQKEELLVFRGEQYKQAVKLFVRKVGRFPTSLDELENTNRLRFLRRRYMDPLTGKDDWRMIHAGPGGIITDSKVQTASTGKGPNALGQGAVFAGFNNSFSGDTTAITDNVAPNAALRQRASATKNAASVTNDPFGTSPTGDSVNANGNQEQALVLDPNTGQPVSSGQAETNNVNPNGAQTGLPGSNGPNLPGGGSNGITSVQDQLNNQNPRQPEQAQTQQNSAFGNTSAFGNQQNSLTGAQGNGVIGGAGGIAGVASNAPGKSIKAVNDQTKYKLWEFYYDLKKDQAAGVPGGVQQNANGANPNGTQTNGTQTNGSQTSAFGQSGFGQSQQSGQSPSGFGGSTGQQGFSQTQPAPPPPQPVPQQEPPL